MYRLILLGALSIGLFADTAVDKMVDVYNLETAKKTKYEVKINEHGVILNSQNNTIYLGESCDVISTQNGKGQWEAYETMAFFGFRNKHEYLVNFKNIKKYSKCQQQVVDESIHPRSWDQSLERWEGDCNYGSSMGCSIAGSMYESGDSVIWKDNINLSLPIDKDVKKALSLYKKGCSIEEQNSEKVKTSCEKYKALKSR